MNKQQRIEVYHYLDNHLGEDEMNYINEILDEHEQQQAEISRLSQELAEAREYLRLAVIGQLTGDKFTDAVNSITPKD